MKQYNSMGYRDNEKGITSHYGILIDDHKPITGVMNINDSAYLHEDIFDYGIDTYFEEHLKECTNEDHDECFYHDDTSEYLIGYKMNDETGYYEEDHNKEYCAIINKTTAQITYSEYVSKCSLCSPCYPGQGDCHAIGVLVHPSDHFEPE